MALLAKLRPCGPWRVGPDSGDRLRADRVMHSDTLYAALTHAFVELGLLEEWIEATAGQAESATGSAVRMTSCFPFVDDVLFLTPPDTLWPPQESLRIRWQSARYVATSAVTQLLAGKQLVEEHWVVDGVSECLLPVIRNVPVSSPFRVAIRSRAAIDRMGAGVEPFQTACLEFSKGAGIWTAFTFGSAEAEATWGPRVEGALRLIADSGLGGERSSGWGRFEQPEFARGEIGQLLFGQRYRTPDEISGYWLLSLFSPAASDAVDWQQGSYRVVTRTGRTAGSGEKKRANQLIAEGSVLVSASELRGAARNVAPESYPHPVYRAGFAFTLPIGKPKPPVEKAPPPVKKAEAPAPQVAEEPVVEAAPVPVEAEVETKPVELPIEPPAVAVTPEPEPVAAAEPFTAPEPEPVPAAEPVARVPVVEEQPPVAEPEAAPPAVEAAAPEAESGEKEAAE